MLVLVDELRTETNDFLEPDEPEVRLCGFWTPRVFRDAMAKRRWSVFIAAPPRASTLPENTFDGSWELAPLPEFLEVAPGDVGRSAGGPWCGSDFLSAESKDEVVESRLRRSSPVSDSFCGDVWALEEASSTSSRDFSIPESTKDSAGFLDMLESSWSFPDSDAPAPSFVTAVVSCAGVGAKLSAD